MNFLTKIQDYTDFQKIEETDYEELAQEIRNFLINLTKQKEIHFSSNLGVVELTIALLKVFDLNQDWILYDTGHQTYVHKLLTGRVGKMATIRSFGGLAGLMNREESKYDHYSPGHSGNTISVLMGLSEGKQRRFHVVIIGDSGFTNGISWEALNDLGMRQRRLIIVLNDNGMSISPSVGGFAKWMRSGKDENAFANYWEAMGFQYIGIVDGHNYADLKTAFQNAQKCLKPVIVHVKTVKGKGSSSGTDCDGQLHASVLKPVQLFGKTAVDWLKAEIKENHQIRILNPAMSIGTGCQDFENQPFFFDTGIAEEHTLSYASGMSLVGLDVYVIIYATFLQRAYDQLIHDFARLKLKLTLLIDRADLNGGDGESHHGIFDVGFLKTVPNVIITAPRNEAQLKMLLSHSKMNKNQVWAIRYPKKAFCESFNFECDLQPFHWEWLIQDNNRICVLTYGPYTDVIYEMLKTQKLACDLVNACYLTGYVETEMARLIQQYDAVICYERIYGNLGLVSDLYAYVANWQTKTKIIAMHYKSFCGRGETNKIDQANQMDVHYLAKVITKLTK